MKTLIDLHCHTMASGHAYSTMEEMITKAKQKDIKVLGISDHAPSMPGASHIYYFFNLSVIPRNIDGVTILKGVETNILDYEGNIDMPSEALQKLDYAIASLHPPCIDPGTVQENTNALINAMKNPYVKIIGHPDDSRYPIDAEALVKASKLYNVALEINNSSLKPTSFREGAHENIKSVLILCKKYNTKVIFGSDAHFSYDVGDFSCCIDVIEEIDFPKELIINYSKEAINHLINEDIL
ncbi:PHP C-terminal domain protein [Alkaliphilus metalliredigens QYMF]|uniref:PHP C-terminal domain protein n=1 Tax=Alkaliphilus metalliredigens (strain QYMF) TaxID=293826 RepID=A6TUI2_ALKMQ|nr:phosphatase [Alkaliphilus metalliredigens]ABR49850.1 PHP C-terminal domain protein [Alkaliphilus metalliredigens QYMF]